MPAADVAATPDAALVTPPGMLRQTFPAMGTAVSVLVPAAHGDDFATVEALFASWEATLTRFDPASELSRLNAAAGRPMVVSPFLFEVLAIARRAAEATDGLFDPTLLGPLEAIGYDRDFADLAAGAAPTPPDPGWPASGGWRSMRLDRDGRSVTLPAGSGLDLGGLAKGMAVDAALGLLSGRKIRSAAVDAGGDLGVVGRPPGAEAWQIAVEAPDGERVVSLTSGALATSSVWRRHWRQAGVTRHHLIDPRTGLPAEGPVRSVSVAAPTCAQAEVAAKAAFLLGPDAGSRFLGQRALPGLFLLSDGSEYRAGPWTA